RQIEAQEAGTARDVAHLGRRALALQTSGDQAERQIGGGERTMEAAEVLGPAAEILRQRVVVVEDVDHAPAASRSSRSRTCSGEESFSSTGSRNSAASRR